MGGSTAIGAGPATVSATRYVAPLREGGSLPALVEADDDGLYVLKFRGAGQGPRALVAELVAAGIGRLLGLPVPDVVLVHLDPELGRAEPDPEIQDLLTASAGLNVGVDYLPGALAYDPAAGVGVDPALAAEIAWFDALLTNVDRTPRNPNLLVWHGRLWLIDHGASLYRHHRPEPLAPQARRPFPAIADHVLLPYAAPIPEADGRLAPRLGPDAIAAVLAGVPDEWIADAGAGQDAEARRADYADYMRRRLAPPREFAEEAERARRGA